MSEAWETGLALFIFHPWEAARVYVKWFLDIFSGYINPK